MGLLGTIGSIGGSAIGGYFGGTTGASIGGQIGGAIGNGISSLASTAAGYAMDMKQTEKLMSMQYDMQKKLALNKYPWEVASLEAAGLNPILAATRGASAYTANAPVINAKRGQESVSNALALGQLQNLAAQNDLIRSQAMSASSTAKQVEQQAIALARENEWFRKNPRFYAAYMASRSVPHPVSGGMLSLLTDEFSRSSSARSIPNKEYFRGGYDY